MTNGFLAPPRLAALFVVAICATAPGQVRLSAYLGGPSGSSVNQSNPPFMSLIGASGYAVGVDTAGNWTGGAPIQFVDVAQPFTHGIGQHPDSELAFDLDQIRSDTGLQLCTFEAVVGIDPVGGGGQNGATFTVFVDGVVSSSVAIAGSGAASGQVSVNVAGAHILALRTRVLGAYFGNHACWANASLLDVGCNTAPTADAGADQVVDEGVLVTLDGSSSNDPNGDLLTYAWTQVAGSIVALSNPAAPQPSFTAPWVALGGETLSFQLVVDDGALASAADVVNVTVKNVNHPPVADAGPDQGAIEGSIVTLDGTGSYDEDGEPLAFLWSQVGGTPVVLSSTTVATPSFTAPAVGTAGEVLTFELVVGDDIDVSAADQVQVAVTNLNNPPTADAGPSQTVAEGVTVVLDGSNSNDPDGDPLGYCWSQVSGPAVTLSDPQAVSPSFTAPDVIGSVELVFSLSVFDSNGAMAPAAITTVTVRDGNAPPDCQNARPSVAALWPPNHKMVEVEIDGVTDPDDQAIQITVTGVWQDEPTTGQGNGDSGPDAVLQGDHVLLRAERRGGGNGRVYHVSFVASDGAGGQCGGTVQVIVPHDRRGGAVDDGPLHDSTR